MRTIIILLAATAVVSGAQAESQRYTVGQSAKVCGTVTAQATDAPYCATVLRVSASNGEVDVVVPAAFAKQLTPSADRMRGAEGCFTGLVSYKQNNPTVSLTIQAVSDVEVTVAPPPDTFGRGALHLCEPGVVAPKPVFERRPEYSEQAMRARIEGLVLMEAVVGVDGAIAEARVIRSLHLGLDELALKALRQWHFIPARLDDRAVPVRVFVEMSFRLKK